MTDAPEMYKWGRGPVKHLTIAGMRFQPGSQLDGKEVSFVGESNKNENVFLIATNEPHPHLLAKSMPLVGTFVLYDTPSQPLPPMPDDDEVPTGTGDTVTG